MTEHTAQIRVDTNGDKMKTSIFIFDSILSISNVIFHFDAGNGECDAIKNSGGATKHQKMIKHPIH